MTPIHLHRPTEADLPVKDEHAAARAVVKLNDPTHPDLPDSIALLKRGDWINQNFAEIGRDMIAEHAQTLARNQCPDVMSWPGDFDGKHDTPRFAGLQQGDVRQRWIDRQPPVDRWIFRAAIPVTVFGAAIGLALIWGVL